MGNRYQQPCSIDWSAVDKEQERSVLKSLVIFSGVVIGIAAFTHGCMDSASKTAEIQRQKSIAAQSPLTSEQEEYRKFFTRHGSPEPVEMAKAVTAVKPRNRQVLAAVAAVESKGDSKAVGDGGKSQGAFQVQPRYWGEVSTDPVDQALQAERILEQLVASTPRRHLLCALAIYNGGPSPAKSAYVYANRVIKVSKSI